MKQRIAQYDSRINFYQVREPLNTRVPKLFLFSSLNHFFSFCWFDPLSESTVYPSLLVTFNKLTSYFTASFKNPNKNKSLTETSGNLKEARCHKYMGNSNLIIIVLENLHFTPDTGHKAVPLHSQVWKSSLALTKTCAPCCFEG